MTELTSTVPSLRDEVAEFLYREAELADANDYDGWLELWDAPCTYWVPCNIDDYDPEQHLSIIYDDRDRLEERCVRLTAGGAHSQEPGSKSCRVVGNIRVMSSDASGDEVTAVAKVMLVELRRGQKSVYASTNTYRLRRVDGRFKLREKKVALLDCDEPLGNMTFLL